MDLSKQLERARDAASRGNEDYSVQLYQDLLALAPDNLQARKELLETVVRRYRKLGVASAGKATTYTKGLVPLLKLQLFSMLKKHHQAMVECEKFLALDPGNRVARKVLAKSARGAGYRETAIWVYEWLADTNRKDADVLYALGELYEEKKDTDRAIEWFELYRKARPSDRRTDARLRNLDAQRTMAKSGWEQAGGKGGFQRFIRDTQEAEDLLDETRLIRTVEDWERAVARIGRELQEEPGNKRLLIQLGDTYRGGADFKSFREVYPKARDCYRKAHEADPADYVVVERLENLKISEYDQLIADAKSKREGSDDSAGKAKLDKLYKQRQDYALKVYEHRVQVRPTDTVLRFELAELYQRYDQVDKAMQQYQHAVRDPKLRKQSLNRLGQCMMSKRIYDMAIARFEEAIKGIVVIGPEDKDILYNLGVAAEAAGDTAKAEDAFKRIYEADIPFKDVSQKIEDIYRKRREEQTKGASG